MESNFSIHSNKTQTSDKFKNALDKFLKCVADVPYLTSGVNNSSGNSNDIYDSPSISQTHSPISTTVEQNTTRQNQHTHQETKSESSLPENPAT